MAGLPEVIGLLHRADWTRLSLSAEVRFESGRAALLIAPGGHYRMEHGLCLDHDLLGAAIDTAA
jgi:hypothetical protein